MASVAIARASVGVDKGEAVGGQEEGRSLSGGQDDQADQDLRKNTFKIYIVLDRLGVILRQSIIEKNLTSFMMVLRHLLGEQ